MTDAREDYRTREERGRTLADKLREKGAPETCQSVHGCRNPACGQAKNGAWLCLPCLAADDR
jgi:hypothetical protein